MERKLKFTEYFKREVLGNPPEITLDFVDEYFIHIIETKIQEQDGRIRHYCYFENHQKNGCSYCHQADQRAHDDQRRDALFNAQ